MFMNFTISRRIHGKSAMFGRKSNKPLRSCNATSTNGSTAYTMRAAQGRIRRRLNEPGICSTMHIQPKHASALRFDNGAIELIGLDTPQSSYRPGDKVDVTVCMRVARRPSAGFRLQVEAWLEPGEKQAHPRPVRSSARLSAGGTFSSSRWRRGELVRDKITVGLPRNWKSGPFKLGIRMLAANKTKVEVQGVTNASDNTLCILDHLDL